jgi:branched-chain amino acid transport system permease protein
MCAGILSFWQALPIAIAISMLFGLLFGLPVLRLRGDHLALVTLGFGEITRIVLRADDFRDLFGAAQGIANVPRPVLDLSFVVDGLSISFDRENGIYYLILAGIVAAIFVAARLKNSRVGRAWSAARADPDVAAAMGINLMRMRLLAVVLGALFAGLAGAMSAIRFYGVYPDSFSLQVTLTVLTIVLVGRVGSIPGVIIAALMLIGLPELLRELYDYRLLLFGLLLIVITRMKSSSPQPTAGKGMPVL